MNKMSNDSENFAEYVKSKIGNPKSKIRNRYDTVVIGAGLAGLTTGCLLAQAGQKALLIANGAGALLLASGCVDVLGYHPTDSTEPVANPLDKMSDFLASRPNHPYNFVGRENIKFGLDAFAKLVTSLNYVGSANANWLLPGPAGAVHPTCLVPTSLANGELSKGGRMLIVGFNELRDFYPALISQNLNAQKLGVQTGWHGLNLPAPLTGKMNVTPIELAHAFEQVDFRQRVVNAVKSAAKGYSRIGFPAVLGIEQHADVLADLEAQLGKTVFEISALPPSVPGRRLFETLKHAFVQAGGQLIIGSKVVDGKIEDGQVTQIRHETVNRLRAIRASNYVLATGGIYGGGIETDSDGNVSEPIFNLPVEATENRHDWFSRKFIESQGQPFAQFGVTVNENLNPTANGVPIATNLYIAGATIAGSDWVQGRTGDGVAIATAAAILNQIMLN